ncbi:MAG: hypothetical protein GX089_01010 [Fibrobacter sp.]|jgi:thymidylate synthase ThyX|nr:hypothetical protein [Fibrobacter sp.]
MKIKAIGICPPPSAQDNPKVTPELLASCLARYSRSNRGIDSILSSIDWNDPDRSVDAIFRFVDYGHASITGMTGGIAMVVDGCSMFLAYKLFEIAQLCDGQESSTRYIKLAPSSLPSPAQTGMDSELAEKWQSLMELSFRLYQETYQELDLRAKQDSSIMRLPSNADQKVIERLRKNFALDRARYFIPFATLTNAAYVMTARVWADTIKNLDSIPLKEAHDCAEGLRSELSKFVPRMMKHSYPDKASKAQAEQLFEYSSGKILRDDVFTGNVADEVYVSVERNFPDFLPQLQGFSEAFSSKENRYSAVGNQVKRIFVRAAWNNMAIAELRDLNRHRSGFRFSPLSPVGFYLPQGVSNPSLDKLLAKKREFLMAAAASSCPASYVYGLLLGTQVSFEHSTHLDKFIYEIELRTGMGAHFRYAEHLSAAHQKLIPLIPELKDYIQAGTAEPE